MDRDGDGPNAVFSRAINLEEQKKAGAIIGDVWNAVVSPDGKLLAVSERVSSQVLLYDTRTGKLVERLVPTLDLSDTFVSFRNSPYVKRSLILRSEWKDSSGRVAREEIQRRFLENKFENAVFIDNQNLLLCGTLTGLERKGDYKYHLMAQTTLFRYNTQSKALQCLPIDFNRNKTFAQADAILFDSKSRKVYTTGMNFDAVKLEHFDSAYTISVLSEDGGKISDILPLPSELRSRPFGYNFFEVHFGQHPNGDILAMFNSLPYVYNITSGKRVELQDTPGSNTEAFAIAREQPDIPAETLNKHIQVRYFPFAVSNAGSLLVPIFYRQSTDDTDRWTVHEYSPSGELIKKIDVKGAEGAKEIKFVTYSQSDNLIVVIAVGENGWSANFQPV